MATPVNQYNTKTKKREKIGGGAYQEAGGQPVSEIVPTQATTDQPTTPTQATDAQRNAWDKMDLEAQKKFVQSNTGFDPTKYSLSYKSATSTSPVEPLKNQPEGGVMPKVDPNTPTVLPKKTQELDNLTNDATRLQQVSDNLNNLYKSNQDLFTDRATFDKYFKFGERGTEQKDLLNQFYTQREAERKILSKGAEQIAKDGDNVDFLKLQDPQLYNQIQQEKQKIIDKQENNNTLSTIAKQAGFSDIGEHINELEDKIMDTKGIEDFPEILASKNKITEIDTQIADLDKTLAEIREQIISQYPGVPSSMIESIITDKSNKIIQQKNGLINQKNSEVGYANNRVDIYNLQKDEIAKQIEDFSKLYGLYQETPEGMAEMAMAKYNAENPDLNSSDEATATRALSQTLDTYFADYQSIIQRPKAQVVADVLAYAKANGVSVSQALKDNFVAPLMGKSEYKQIQNKALGLTDGWTKLSDTMLYNTNTGEFKYTNGSTPNIGLGSTSTPGVEQTKIDAAVQQIQSQGDGSIGGQCGSFANDYLEGLGVGRIFTDPIDAKVAVTNSTTPKIGSVAVIDWSNNPNATESQKKYGHVGVVIAINGNKITLKQSNKDGTEKIFTSDYDASQIKGYYDPSKGASNIDTAAEYDSLSTTAKLLLDGDLSIADIKNYPSDQKTEIFNAQKELKEKGKATVDTKLYNNLQKSKEALEALGTGEDIKAYRKIPGFEQAIGASPAKFAAWLSFNSDTLIPGSAGASYLQTLNTALANLTTPALQNMKGLGSMSDIEFANIQALAGGGISRSVSEVDFVKKLNKLRESIDRGMKDIERKGLMSSNNNINTPAPTTVKLP